MVEPGVIVGSVLSIAIGGGLITGLIAIICSHRERMARIKSQGAKGPEKGQAAAFDELRDEVAKLRDTSTQYDLSLQRSLEEIQHRLAVVESRTLTPGQRSTSEEAVSLGVGRV